MATGSRFLTPLEVSEVLSVTIRQVRALLNAGDLRGIQVGGRGQWRIEHSQLEDYIARQYARSDEKLQADDRAESPSSGHD